jgi:predicted HTH domain antitoxin
MLVELPELPVAAARLTPEQARLEVAIALFQQERLSLGLASEMAGLRVAEMMTEISRRRLSFHYGIEELREDLASLVQPPRA